MRTTGNPESSVTEIGVSHVPSHNAGCIIIDENGNRCHYTAEQYAAKVREDQMNAKFDAIIALLTEIRDRLTKASQ